MERFTLGTLVGRPVEGDEHLLAQPVAAMMRRLNLEQLVGVAEIDPELSETAATQRRYGLDPATLVNCVIVAGKRARIAPTEELISQRPERVDGQRARIAPTKEGGPERVDSRHSGEQRLAACLVPSTKRVDVNGVVRRRLDVRKASFLPQADAVERTGMAYGGITPIGLPEGWPILIDADVADIALVVIGSGIRASKLLVPGALLAQLPGAETIAELGRAG